jgi:hypothetical protein
MKSVVALCLSLLCAHLSFAQQANWSISPYDDRYFVENIGQYDPIDGVQVVAGVDNLGTEIFYTPSGFTYRIRKAQPMPVYLLAQTAEDEAPDNEGEDHTRLVWDTISLAAHWVGASRNTPQLLELQKPVFHYAKNGTQLVGARSYERLSQPNLYPGIDLSYTFHPDEGIKYDFTVHPGGDASRIALAFEGMDAAFLDALGNLHVTLGAASLIDHAPKAYLRESATPVQIQFVLSGATVRFEIADYDHAQTLVIDPWIINPGFTTEGKAFDVSWDCSGNVYAFGGSGPWKVKKFTSAGALVWTYNTSHTQWYGDLISDDVGNVYIIEGCCNGNRQKLNTGGVVQWTTNDGVYEFWRLAFSCDFSKLSLANAYSGGGIAPAQSLSNVNFSTGVLTGGVVIATSEPRSLTGAPSGNFYALTSVGNEVVARNNSYGPLYNVGSGYSLLYNGPLYSNGLNTTQGQNGIAVYGAFIFTSDGATLRKRNIATGALVTSVAIPGGGVELYSGVSVDNCGNVFVGSNGNVYRYDANLTPVATLPMTGAVYDVSVSGTSTLLISGNDLLASQVAPCAAVCPTCVILPAGLASWGATVNEQAEVELQWSVSRAEDYAGFTVQRSADGIDFTALQAVNAGLLSYMVRDASPLRGYAWYRLELVDVAGNVTHSPLRQVHLEAATRAAMMVYPNPSQGYIAVRFPAPLAQAGRLEVRDAQGRVVLAQWISTDAVATSLDVAALPVGIYMLRLGELGTVRFCRE